MGDMIFSDFGIEVYKRDGRFFVRYDDGEIVVHVREDEITEVEAWNTIYYESCACCR